MDLYRILQIMPATGVEAVYVEDDGELNKAPLHAWALCEDLDEVWKQDYGFYPTEIRGLDITTDGLQIVEDCINFLGYDDGSGGIDWEVKAKERLETLERRHQKLGLT